MVRAIKNISLRTVNKTRELKCSNFSVDEYQMTIGGSGPIHSNMSNNRLMNYVARGDARNQRNGNQINPQRFTLKGWCKIQGYSNSSAYQELKVRVVVGYMDNNTIADLIASSSTVPYFWNGQPVIATGDYRDILRNLNYKAITPMYDRTYSIAPAPEYTFDSTQTTTQTKLKDYFNIYINKKLPSRKELTWDPIANDMWQEKNIVALAFIRTMNDDTVITTNVVEFNLEGNFYYHDA